MKRRQLITLLGAVAATRPETVLAQQTQAGHLPIIGSLLFSPGNPAKVALDAELERLGWVEGKTAIYDVRVVPPDLSGLQTLANELASRPVTLIITGAPGITAAQRATRTIPIIGIADDMKANGFVSNIARPGGNTTGVSIFAPELDVKRLALLTELVPTARRIAVLTESKAGPSMARLDAAARELRIELVVAEARNGDEIGPALDSIVVSRVEAVNVLAAGVFNTGRKGIVARMNAERLPAIYQWPEYPHEEGALIGYGPRQALIGQLLAGQVDRVLRGALPGDLPIVQPTKFELVINLKSAKALGLTVPPSLLLRADEVID
jgi:putative ABC transport system substrate-binding protein